METRGYDRLIGSEARDSAGEDLGKIEDIYYDDVSQRPEWVVLKGRRFVPLAGARIESRDDGDDDDQRLIVSATKSKIESAPKLGDDDEHLDPAAEQALYRHYGFNWGSRLPNDGGYGRSGNRFDQDWAVNTQPQRRERGEVVAEATAVNEQVQKTAQPETVRLRKYHWTENVPVEREEVRVEQGGTQTRTMRNA